MTDTETHVESGPGGQFRVTGPALAVIAIIAVLGILYLAGRAFDIAERAAGFPSSPPPPAKLMSPPDAHPP